MKREYERERMREKGRGRDEKRVLETEGTGEEGKEKDI